jgi:hypothetical protein
VNHTFQAPDILISGGRTLERFQEGIIWAPVSVAVVNTENSIIVANQNPSTLFIASVPSVFFFPSSFPLISLLYPSLYFSPLSLLTCVGSSASKLVKVVQKLAAPIDAISLTLVRHVLNHPELYTLQSFHSNDLDCIQFLEASGTQRRKA